MQNGKFIHPNKINLCFQIKALASIPQKIASSYLEYLGSRWVVYAEQLLAQSTGQNHLCYDGFGKVFFFPVLCGGERDPQLLVDKYLSDLET